MKLRSSVAVITSILCGLQPALANYKRCIDNVDYSKDYFPNKITPKYSKNWIISYHNTYKIIKNTVTDTSYLLYQCGTEPPASEAGNHELTLSVPLQDGIVVSSTTTIPHLKQLGLRRQIKAYLGNPQYVSSPCIQTMLSEGAIETLYDDYSFTTEGRSLSEYLVDKPDALVFRSSNQGSNVFVVSEKDEAESLDIYEWHLIYGALFNLEETANKQFAEAEERFLCNSHNAEFIFKNRESETKKPTVMWARYSDWAAPFYWDVGRCDAQNEYYCDFAQRCAAELLHSNNGTVPNIYEDGDFHMTDSEFFEFAKDADHWIYTGYNWDATYDKFKDDLASFKSVQSNEVYDVLGSGTGPWFEDRLAEFDLVLQDFCDVVGHYDETDIKHTRQYFRKVMGDEKQSVPSAEVCEPGFIDIPWESRASQCVRFEEEVDDTESSAVGLSSKVALVSSLILSTIALLV